MTVLAQPYLSSLSKALFTGTLKVIFLQKYPTATVFNHQNYSNLIFFSQPNVCVTSLNLIWNLFSYRTLFTMQLFLTQNHYGTFFNNTWWFSDHISKDTTMNGTIALSVLKIYCLSQSCVDAILSVKQLHIFLSGYVLYK